MLRRPALGQAASLGDLYDARSDTFLPFKVLRRAPARSAVSVTDNPGCEVKYSRSDSFRDKFSLLNIGPNLSASYLAGFVTVDGSARYLNAKRDTNLTVQASLLYNVTTVSEVINFQSDKIEDCLALNALQSDLPTHVVAGIDWGSRNVITVKSTLSQKAKSTEISAKLEAQLTILGARLSPVGGDASYISSIQEFDSSFEVTIFGDVIPGDTSVLTDLPGVTRFLNNVPKYVSETNGGKGRALVYTLLPISELSKLLQCQIRRALSIQQLSLQCSDKFVDIFDEIAAARRELSDYLVLLRENGSYFSKGLTRSVGDRFAKLRAAESGLQSEYKKALTAVRSCQIEETALWNIIEGFSTGETAIRRLGEVDVRPAKEKIQLISGLIARGATYIGFNGESFDLEIGSVRNVDIYVFHLSEEARQNTEAWKQHVSLLHCLLDDSQLEARVIVKDCDAFGERLQSPRISLVRDAEEIVEDFWHSRQEVLSKSTARFTRSQLDRSGAPKPTSRLPVKMPCPGPNCSISISHEWICAACGCRIEYGHSDQYIYCDCGRCDFRHWTFRCSSRQHGQGYDSFDESRLLEILEALEAFEELNILILGPTGVGKSTWINAFINYLRFQTLDDALEPDQEFESIIPFAFRAYSVDEYGEFENIHVKVDADENLPESATHKLGVEEMDGTKGESATQNTAVHRVQIGSLLLRIIDTPGVGDTRGPWKDKENMADILSVLRLYDNIHGILILLKPNDQRLHIMFKFCIQELLAHLHCDAAGNIAFGFTNTRGTNYMPGDTFDPLLQLLRNFENAQITLRKHNVFCFDSESFRYLAAWKQFNRGIGQLDDNRASWSYSVTESKRLIKYFCSLKPHKVTSTVNLYETRHRVLLMTEPMAEIAEKIRYSISVNEDDINHLSNNELERKELESKLRMAVKSTNAVQIEKPRTTCSDESCIERSITDTIGADGRNVLRTVYRRSCHSPCYLNNVEVDNIGYHSLRHCWAMNDTNTCRVCGHPWNSHLHVKIEYEDTTIEINDPVVEEKLKKNADFQAAKEASIAAKKQLIEELKGELEEIAVAAAQFSSFLKRNAIRPYNDATMEHLDRCIADEKGHVGEGGSRDKLDRLEKYRQQYEQQVKILDEYMDKGEHHKLLDQAGVKDQVVKIHSLKHYGDTIRKVGLVIQSSESVPHCGRERPYVVQARPHWTGEEVSGHPTHSKTKAGRKEDSGRGGGSWHNWHRWRE